MRCWAPNDIHRFLTGAGLIRVNQFLTYHPIMRRVLVRIVLLLVIGAVINVAIAWGLAIRYDQIYTTPWSNMIIPNRSERTVWWTYGAKTIRTYGRTFGEVAVTETRGRDSPFGEIALSQQEFVAALPTWSALHDTFPLGEFDSATALVENGFGWPLISVLHRRWYWRDSTDSSGYRGKTVGLITIPTEWVNEPDSSPLSQYFAKRRNMLPLIPIWPGFYINTLLYACAAWLVFFAPFAALRFTKRARRRRRGLCLRCGYDLRGAMNATCPECGAALSEPRP